jgi:hypothetical protein
VVSGIARSTQFSPIERAFIDRELVCIQALRVRSPPARRLGSWITGWTADIPRSVIDLVAHCSPRKGILARRAAQTVVPRFWMSEPANVTTSIGSGISLFPTDNHHGRYAALTIHRKCVIQEVRAERTRQPPIGVESLVHQRRIGAYENDRSDNEVDAECGPVALPVGTNPRNGRRYVAK